MGALQIFVVRGDQPYWNIGSCCDHFGTSCLQRVMMLGNVTIFVSLCICPFACICVIWIIIFRCSFVASFLDLKHARIETFMNNQYNRSCKNWHVKQFFWQSVKLVSCSREQPLVEKQRWAAKRCLAQTHLLTHIMIIIIELKTVNCQHRRQWKLTV